jgi:hypothetical protein
LYARCSARPSLRRHWLNNKQVRSSVEFRPRQDCCHWPKRQRVASSPEMGWLAEARSPADPRISVNAAAVIYCHQSAPVGGAGEAGPSGRGQISRKHLRDLF